MAGTKQKKRQRDRADDGKDGQEKRIRREYEYDYNSLITVLVGDHERPFSVHKDNICAKSKFFAAACSPDRWQEGKERLVRLPEADPNAFQAYVHWVYTGEIVAEVHWGKTSLEEDEIKVALVEAFLSGDVLDDAELRRKAIDMLILDHANWTLTLQCTTMARIWSATPTPSPLRRFCMETIINRLSRTSFAENLAEFPTELTQELAVALMQRTEIIDSKDSLKDLQDKFQPDKCTI